MTNSYDFKIHTQTTRKQYIKILILDNDRSPLIELQGHANNGTYNITNGSAIRRTCSITMTLDSDRLLPTSNSYFWVDRRFQLYTGIQDLFTNTIQWYNQGIYVIKSPATNLQIGNRTLQISGLDLAALQNGDISGTLDTVVKINAGTPIHAAIYSTITTLGCEDVSRVFVENTPYSTPYDLEFDAGSTVWDIISELTKLYMNYESFYDENGYFIFKKKSTLLGDAIEWDFERYNVINAIQKTINYNNVKNRIVVRGKILDSGEYSGLQPNYEIRVRSETAEDIADKAEIIADGLTDISAIVNRTDSEFALDKLSETKFRTLYIQEDTYYSLDQCEQRAKYEYDQHNNVNATVSLTVVPIYCLTVNQLIKINDVANDIVGVFVINDISGQLAYSGLMTINCSQVYN